MFLWVVSHNQLLHLHARCPAFTHLPRTDELLLNLTKIVNQVPPNLISQQPRFRTEHKNPPRKPGTDKFNLPRVEIKSDNAAFMLHEH